MTNLISAKNMRLKAFASNKLRLRLLRYSETLEEMLKNIRYPIIEKIINAEKLKKLLI